MQFKLWFSANGTEELLRTELMGSLSGERLVSVRGKTAGAHGSRVGSFQWTPAVQALSVLLLEAVAEQESEYSGISGHGGSLAASLDYALGKPPVWLLEMFGSGVNGEAFAKRLFRRSNPERKRPGPVVVSLNRSLWGKSSIEIYLGERRVAEGGELLALAQAIQSRSGLTENIGASAAALAAGERSEDRQFSQVLKQSFFREISDSVLGTDVFSSQGLKRVRSRIDGQLSVAEDRRFPNQAFSDSLEQGLLSSERLGALPPDLERCLRNWGRFTVAIPAGMAGGAAIFAHLRDNLSLPLEMDYHYQYAIEIMHKMLDARFVEPPEFCALGLAPAASVLNSSRPTGYRPLMLLPTMSHRVVAPKSQSLRTASSARAAGTYLMLRDDFSTSQIYFEQLVRVDQIQRRRINVQHSEPHEIAKVFAAGDEDRRGILFFPYYDINRELNRCEFLDDLQGDLHHTQSVIFAHERVFADPGFVKAFCLAVRDSWLSLREDVSARQRTVESLMQDKRFLRVIRRFSGL